MNVRNAWIDWTKVDFNQSNKMLAYEHGCSLSAVEKERRRRWRLLTCGRPLILQKVSLTPP